MALTSDSGTGSDSTRHIRLPVPPEHLDRLREMDRSHDLAPAVTRTLTRFGLRGSCLLRDDVLDVVFEGDPTVGDDTVSMAVGAELGLPPAHLGGSRPSRQCPVCRWYDGDHNPDIPHSAPPT